MLLVFSMDYKKYLNRCEKKVLPYMGGAFVASKTRKLRVKGASEPAWYEFEVTGRTAKAVKKVDVEEEYQLG